jgi:hypothetical protein
MNHSNGTFVAVKFKKEVAHILNAYCINFNIPNRLDMDDYHSSIIYSRVPLKNVPESRDLDTHWIAKPIRFDVFTSTRLGTKTNCLVLIIDCPEMNARHHFLKHYENASHDWPTYNAHITLSYDIGDFDVRTLRPIDNVLGKIAIVKEFSMELKNHNKVITD